MSYPKMLEPVNLLQPLMRITFLLKFEYAYELPGALAKKHILMNHQPESVKVLVALLCLTLQPRGL